MKTLYITTGHNIVVDTENDSCNRLDKEPVAIDQVYVAKEPLHVVYGSGEYHKELDAEPGDIIIVFYSVTFDNRIIVVKNDKWLENLLNSEKREQELKEKWASEGGKSSAISR